MFLSLKLSKKTVIILVAGIVIAVLLIGLDIMQREVSAKTAQIDGETYEQRIAFLSDHGWQAGEETESVQVVIPSVWNEVYERYNGIQQNDGFDLLPYKGKQVTRYTYEILNYPDEISGVYANILVFEGKIIGGDICTYDLDGFMHSFTYDSELTGVSFGEGALGY